MKQGHFAVFFMTIYVACFSFLLVEQNRYDKVLAEKMKIEQALLNAIELAGKEFTSAITMSDEKKQQVFEQSFWTAFCVSMGILEEIETQEQIKMFFPLLVLVEEDGAFFYHVQEVMKNDEIELVHMWSERISFSFSEDCSDALRKCVMAETLEKVASEYITNHNYIASQYGISYTFTVPSFLQNTSGTLSFPMFFAVFQGWPLTAAGNVLYENCVDAGGYLQEKEHYVVELPESLEKTESIYHHLSCSKVVPEGKQFQREYMTEQEVIYKYGAYPCKLCQP